MMTTFPSNTQKTRSSAPGVWLGLPVKADIRKRAGLSAGDEVKVELTLID